MRSFFIHFPSGHDLFLKSLHQKPVDTPEFAIAEDADYVALLHLFAEPLDNRGDFCKMSRRNLPILLDLKDEFAHIKSFLGSQLIFSGNGTDGYPVRGAKCLGEFLLEYVAAGGIGARFKSCPDTLRRIALT